MSKVNFCIECLEVILDAAKKEQKQSVTFAISQAIAELHRLVSIEQANQIKTIGELSESGHYWYRVKPSSQWNIMHITDPQRLSYGIASFEFSGPIPAPIE